MPDLQGSVRENIHTEEAHEEELTYPDNPIKKRVSDLANKISNGIRSRSLMPWLLCVAIVLTVLHIIIKQDLKEFEVLGDLLVIFGTLLVANGAVVSRHQRDQLFNVINQEKNRPTKYIRQIDLLRFQLKQLQSKQPRYDQEKNLEGMIAYLESEDKKYYRVSQKDIAIALVETSDYCEAGTVLIVVGTIIVLLASLFVK